MKTDEFRCTADYDSKFDLLSFKRPGMRSSGAIKAGPFTIDFYKNELAGIEVEGASAMLRSLFGLKMDLSKIQKAKIGFKEEGRTFLLFFTIRHQEQDIRKEVLVPKVEPIPIMT
ncbi:MAG: hypothetical protein Q8P02_04255 [Candidatus Micrarchaeota archaeon]|nr:hypothetical protein [Candidatus Micrarchaeota archaeon]